MLRIGVPFFRWTYFIGCNINIMLQIIYCLLHIVVVPVTLFRFISTLSFWNHASEPLPGLSESSWWLCCLVINSYLHGLVFKVTPPNSPAPSPLLTSLSCWFLLFSLPIAGPATPWNCWSFSAFTLRSLTQPWVLIVLLRSHTLTSIHNYWFIPYPYLAPTLFSFSTSNH